MRTRGINGSVIMGVAALLALGGCHGSAPATSVVTTISTATPAAAPTAEPSAEATGAPSTEPTAAAETGTPKPGTPRPSKSPRPSRSPEPTTEPTPRPSTTPQPSESGGCDIQGKHIQEGETAPMDGDQVAGGQDFNYVVQCDQNGNSHVVKRYEKPTNPYYAMCWGPKADPEYAKSHHNLCGDGPAQ
ncbi:MAG TPA: hypothetical protein VGJ14_02125 [Sporichthyaceae bacterium]